MGKKSQGKTSGKTTATGSFDEMFAESITGMTLDTKNKRRLQNAVRPKWNSAGGLNSEKMKAAVVAAAKEIGCF